jgi:hypothetical protein
VPALAAQPKPASPAATTEDAGAPLDALLEADDQGVPLRWHGIYSDGRSYPRGALVAHRNGLWASLEDVRDRPRQSSGWKLILRSPDTRPVARDRAHRAAGAT